jgi:hypothetical protein
MIQLLSVISKRVPINLYIDFNKKNSILRHEAHNVFVFQNLYKIVIMPYLKAC